MELIIGDNARKCTQCEKIKPFSKFNKQKLGKYGYSAWCKNCHNKWLRNWRKGKIKSEKELAKENFDGEYKVCSTCNINKSLEEYNTNNRKKWQSQDCKDCFNKKQNKYRRKKRVKKNRKKFFKDQKIYNAQKKVCKECNKLLSFDKFNTGKHYGLFYICKNCQSKKAKQKRKENADEIREKDRKYMQERRKNSLEIRLIESVRTRVYHALKGNTKHNKTLKLIGCNVQKLKQHLEDQWVEGMSWDNWAIDGWHIDHIKPCASFDLSNPEQQKECFHYTNLQPLWALENIRKSDKLITDR